MKTKNDLTDELAAIIGSEEAETQDIINFLEKNPDYDAKGMLFNGDDLLHIAARSNNLKLLEYLLDKKDFDINQENEEGLTALQITQDESVKQLLEAKKREFDAPDKQDCEDFLKIVRSGDFKKVQEKVKQYPNIVRKAKDEKGNNALHLAAVDNDNLELVEFLVQNGVELYAKNQNEETPARIAKNMHPTMLGEYINSAHLEAIYHDTDEIQTYLKLVRSAKGKFEKIDEEAFIEAIKNQDHDLIERDLGMFPKIAKNAKDEKDNNALHLAAANGDLKSAKLIIEKHPELLIEENKENLIPAEVAEKNQRTIIGYVAGYANTSELKQYLLEAQVRLNLPSKKDQKQFLKDVEENNENKVKEYITKFPNITNIAKDNDGNMALHIAVKEENLELVKILITQGYGDIYAENNEGKMPVDLAVTERVYDRYAEYREDIKEYLDRIDDNLRQLHSYFGKGEEMAATLKDAMPWLDKLKNENDISYEDRTKRREEAFKRSQISKEKKEIEEYNKKESQKKRDKIDQKHLKAEEKHEKILEGKKDKAKNAKYKELVEKNKKNKKLELSALKNDIEQKQKDAIQRKIKLLDEKKTKLKEDNKLKQKKAEEAKNLKLTKNIELEVDTIKNDLDVLIKNNAIKNILNKKVDRENTKLDLLVSDLVSKYKERGSIAQDDIKELAAYVAPERYTAKIAKYWTGRKTDNDLVKEVIGVLKSAIESEEKKISLDEKHIERYSKNRARE